MFQGQEGKYTDAWELSEYGDHSLRDVLLGSQPGGWKQILGSQIGSFIRPWVLRQAHSLDPGFSDRLIHLLEPQFSLQTIGTIRPCFGLFSVTLKEKRGRDVLVVYAFSPSTWEAKVGGSL